jgi:hypothetical protein
LRILNDGGNQAAQFCEIQIHSPSQRLALTAPQ